MVNVRLYPVAILPVYTTDSVITQLQTIYQLNYLALIIEPSASFNYMAVSWLLVDLLCKYEFSKILTKCYFQRFIVDIFSICHYRIHHDIKLYP